MCVADPRIRAVHFSPGSRVCAQRFRFALPGMTLGPRLRRLAGAERPEGEREEGSAGAKRPPSSLQVPAAFRRASL